MGFCTMEQSLKFGRELPEFERTLVDDGIRLFKLYLAVNRKEQKKRLKARRTDPLKTWKLSPSTTRPRSWGRAHRGPEPDVPHDGHDGGTVGRGQLQRQANRPESTRSLRPEPPPVRRQGRGRGQAARFRHRRRPLPTLAELAAERRRAHPSAWPPPPPASSTGRPTVFSPPASSGKVGWFEADVFHLINTCPARTTTQCGRSCSSAPAGRAGGAWSPPRQPGLGAHDVGPRGGRPNRRADVRLRPSRAHCRPGCDRHAVPARPLEDRSVGARVPRRVLARFR